MVFVLLYPSTVEDEGRYKYCGKFGSQRQAEEYIREQVTKSNGYYTMGSYVMAKPI